MDTVKAFLASVLGAVDVPYAEIRLEEAEHSRIVYRGAELDDLGKRLERGGCIRVCDRGNWGVATFNRVDEGLKELAQEVATQVQAMPLREDSLPTLPAYEDVIRVRPEDDPRRVPLAAKNELIRHYNGILLRTAGIETTFSVYLDTHRFVAFLSSEGRYVNQEQVYTGFFCQAVARDGTNIQDYADSCGRSRGFDSLKDREPLVESIAKVAVDLLRAEPVPAGRYTVVVDPLLAGVFAHEAFGHLSEADCFAENDRLRELMKPGTRYGVDGLSIVDDSTLDGERGSYRYDDEGVAGGKTELVRDGVIAGSLRDRQSAARMGRSPTGNARAVSYRHPPLVRMSNTFIVPRDADLDDMLDIERGLYVVGSRGGMTELESFTFSARYARLVEHGRRTKMVRGVTLTGNVFETLRNIDAVGSDLVVFGGLGGCGKGGQNQLPVGIGAPHVRIRDVTVGGS